jgi:tRNA-splicing endonuclease subunit Sen34
MQLAVAEAKLAKEVASSGRAMTEAAIQKRKEREEKKARVVERGAEADVLDNNDDPQSVPPASTANRKPHEPSEMPASKNIQNPLPQHTVTIPSSSSSLEWYNPTERTYSTLADAKTAGIWSYPDTLLERARCGVFRGLWDQRYFMGSGTKFGGDYLVYPGV